MKKQVILCVDDEEIIVRSLRDQIRSMFQDVFEIETALNGEEALEIYDELTADDVAIPLVISDYVMPRMNGDVFLKHIYQRSPKTLKILLTGQATMAGVVSSINEAKLYRYIPKPWEKEDLFLAISEATKSYDRDRQIETQNSMLALQNEQLQQLYREQQELTNAFVETMVSALDQRDTATGGHSKRLGLLATRLASAIHDSNSEKFGHERFSPDRLRQLYYAALLHDVGKIGISEKILLKHSRLSEEAQLALRYKFRCFKLTLQTRSDQGRASAKERELLQGLDATLEFLLDLCRTYFLKEEDERRLQRIALESVVNAEGQSEPLLSTHDLELLLIARGNLTASERNIMQTHASLTYDLLKNIPWPKTMSRIAELAASHHEKLDGSGYFRQIKENELSLETRILAILDIYEALTSIDRPYKKALPPEVALNIIRAEVDSGKLDRDIFELFVSQEIYAMNPEP